MIARYTMRPATPCTGDADLGGVVVTRCWLKEGCCSGVMMMGGKDVAVRRGLDFERIVNKVSHLFLTGKGGGEAIGDASIFFYIYSR